MNENLTNKEWKEIWEKDFSRVDISNNPGELFKIYDSKYARGKKSDRILYNVFWILVRCVSYGKVSYGEKAFYRNKIVTEYKKNIDRIDKNEHPFCWSFYGLITDDEKVCIDWLIKFLDKLIGIEREGTFENEIDSEKMFVQYFFNPFKDGFDGRIWQWLEEAIKVRDMPEKWNLWGEYSGMIHEYIKAKGYPTKWSVLKGQIARYPKIVFTKELLANLCYQDKKYKKAVDYLNETKENAMIIDQFDRFSIMADCYGKLKEYSKEEECIREYLEIIPEHAYGIMKLGICLNHQKRFDEAEMLFRKSIELGEYKAQYELVNLLIKSGRARDAREAAQINGHKTYKNLLERLDKLEEDIKRGKKRDKSIGSVVGRVSSRSLQHFDKAQKGKEEKMDDLEKHENYIEVKCSGEVFARSGTNDRMIYEHQREAMRNMDIVDGQDSYSTLIVLPTGGGKTYTASNWLIRNALDRRKKILWLAHRQMLLDQAAESFCRYAYRETMPQITSFKYRIVSGSDNHDSTNDISPEDDLLIVSKDSMRRNLDKLGEWLKDENEVYLVVDEAHHSTAKTYRLIINYVKERIKNTKIIGLTATPYRTADSERGLLAKIFSDGIEDGLFVRGKRGIAYEISLKELINRGILSKPIFESCNTNELFGEDLGTDDWERIMKNDLIPNDIAEEIVKNKERNRLIVDRYINNKDRYGQTIVFAINKIHAESLAKLFKDRGIPTDFVVSGIIDGFTRVSRKEDNERAIEDYKAGKIKVLINVNILTEGVDLPKTNTVFLARPTTSMTLMTQMVGRALRGMKAGGTKEAYIVSFVDDWNENISWVNPESLFVDDENDFTDTVYEREQYQMRLIAISKIQEFAAIVNETVVGKKLEKIDFKKRIPVGKYVFSYVLQEEDDESPGMECMHQIMVYDSTRKAYEEMMEALPELFEAFGVDEKKEYLSEDGKEAKKIARQIENAFFLGEMIPPYDEKDIIHVLNYYAQKAVTPAYYPLSFVDSQELDVTEMARYIIDEHLDTQETYDYIDKKWDEKEESLLRIFFGKKENFERQLVVEKQKIFNRYSDEGPNVKYGKRKFEDMSLYEIGKVDPDYKKTLSDAAYADAMDEYGYYICPLCKKRDKNKGLFEVDHIKPRNKGGKTIPENLRLLCINCNRKKGDSYPE